MPQLLMVLAIIVGLALVAAAATPLWLLTVQLVPSYLLQAGNPALPHAVATPLLTAATASIVSLGLGGIVALGLWRAPSGVRRLVLTLCIAAVLLAGLHAQASAFFPAPGRPPLAALPGLVVLAAPLVVLILAARLRGLDPILLAAAAASGASPWRAFSFVVLSRLAWPSAAALLLCFIVTAGDSLIGLARHSPLQ